MTEPGRPLQTSLWWLMKATVVVAVALAGGRLIWANPEVSVCGFLLVGLPGVPYYWFMTRLVVPWANEFRPELESHDTSLSKLHSAFGDAVFWSGTVFLATTLFCLGYYPSLFFTLVWLVS